MATPWVPSGIQKLTEHRHRNSWFTSLPTKPGNPAGFSYVSWPEGTNVGWLFCTGLDSLVYRDCQTMERMNKQCGGLGAK